MPVGRRGGGGRFVLLEFNRRIAAAIAPHVRRDAGRVLRACEGVKMARSPQRERTENENGTMEAFLSIAPLDLLGPGRLPATLDAP